jgi:hypothetical protein
MILSAPRWVTTMPRPEGRHPVPVVTPKQPDRVDELYYSAGPAGVPYLELPDKDATYVYIDPYVAQIETTGHPGDDIV